MIISVIRTNYIGKGEIEELLRYYPALEAKDERGKAVIEYQNRYNIMYQAGQRTKEEVEAVRYVDKTKGCHPYPLCYRKPQTT